MFWPDCPIEGCPNKIALVLNSDHCWPHSTGMVFESKKATLAWEDRKTDEYKAVHGDCDCACHWCDVYVWVPECGSPVHDYEG